MLTIADMRPWSDNERLAVMLAAFVLFAVFVLFFLLPIARRQHERDREKVAEFNAWRDRLEKKIDRVTELLERRDGGA